MALWETQYRPASFRGVPFYVSAADTIGGRRLAVTEMLDQDVPSLDDLGRVGARYPVTAYVLGDGYRAARDALRAACENQAGAATLVHPYYGNVTARCGAIRIREEIERNGFCSFDIEFVVSGPVQTASTTSTASSLLGGLTSFLPLIRAAYAVGTLIADRPSVLLGFAEDLLGSAAEQMLGLPAYTLSGLTSLVSSWSTSASDPTDTADLVGETMDDAADNVVAAAAAAALASTDGDSINGNLPLLAVSTDLTGGLAGLCDWGASLSPVPALAAYYGNGLGYTGYVGPTDPTQAPSGVAPLAVQQAVSQQAIVDLVTGAAVAAIATIYAQTDFPTADAADAAATQMADLIDDRITAAAYAGADDLYRAWSVIQGLVVTDLYTRAQALPERTTYALAGSLPSLVLAQRLYADPTRADELVAMNDVSMPSFMPASGICLSS